jgi:hypothetical protein
MMLSIDQNLPLLISKYQLMQPLSPLLYGLDYFVGALVGQMTIHDQEGVDNAGQPEQEG